MFIIFVDIVLIDFDCYRCIYRSTIIVFKITVIYNSAVFIFNNIVSILFLRKTCENENDLASYRLFMIVSIPSWNIWNSVLLEI
jgi:hypothetical protein